MTTETIDFSDAVAKVTMAMENAIAEYGADAVDLALMAYQIDAIKTLLIGFGCIVPLLLTRKLFNLLVSALVTACMAHDETDAQFSACILTAIYSALAGIVFMVGIFDFLADPVMWLAALGRPELLIATKALVAAGLM